MTEIDEIPIIIQLLGLGTVEGLIIRHLAPISADAILDKLPFVLRGRFSIGSKKYWIFPNLGIRKGPNTRAAKKVEKYDIVYSPKTDELVVIFEDLEMPNKVNRVGKVVKNVELFTQARNGINAKLYKKTNISI